MENSSESITPASAPKQNNEISSMKNELHRRRKSKCSCTAFLQNTKIKLEDRNGIFIQHAFQACFCFLVTFWHLFVWCYILTQTDNSFRVFNTWMPYGFKFNVDWWIKKYLVSVFPRVNSRHPVPFLELVPPLWHENWDKYKLLPNKKTITSARCQGIHSPLITTDKQLSTPVCWWYAI